MTKRLADFRREYGALTLTKKNALKCPIEQFNLWFLEVTRTENFDPTAMLLATVDEHGHPDARVVLLKGIEQGDFIFYTNYDSTKALQIRNNPAVSLNFFWPFLSRQVRINGTACIVDASVSDDYFDSRPRKSRIAAHASNQSAKIDSRSTLEEKMNHYLKTFDKKPIVRPKNWGGYKVTPHTFEYWQGRDNRLHDRLRYTKNDSGEVWDITRLEP